MAMPLTPRYDLDTSQVYNVIHNPQIQGLPLHHPIAQYADICGILRDVYDHLIYYTKMETRLSKE